jgi:uncharacterized membrane protein
MAFSVSANRDIERWVTSGLIDRGTADQLYADLANRPGRFGLGAVLGVLGAVLLGVALLSLVAANWNEIPRLMRVAFILTVIAAGYLGGAWRAGKGDAVFSSVLYVIAAIAFGGGIAIVGQMYHLSGDAASAALVWCLGTLAAAVLLLSGNLAVMGALTGLFYLLTVTKDSFINLARESSWHGDHYYWIVPLLALGVAAAAQLTQTRVAAHSVVWLIIGYMITMRLEYNTDYLDYVVGVTGTVSFFALVYFEAIVDKVTHLVRALQAYALGIAFTGLASIQFLLPSANIGASIVLGLAILGLAIAALAVRGRDHGQVRMLAYAAFAFEVLYLAYETVGSIIGTSLFFFLIGVFVMFLAFLVMRLERRFKSPELGGAQ